MTTSNNVTHKLFYRAVPTDSKRGRELMADAIKHNFTYTTGYDADGKSTVKRDGDDIVVAVPTIDDILSHAQGLEFLTSLVVGVSHAETKRLAGNYQDVSNESVNIDRLITLTLENNRKTAIVIAKETIALAIGSYVTWANANGKPKGGTEIMAKLFKSLFKADTISKLSDEVRLKISDNLAQWYEASEESEQVEFVELLEVVTSNIAKSFEPVDISEDMF